MHKTLLTQLTGRAFLMSLIMLQPVSASQSTARSDSADTGVRLFVFNCGDFLFPSLLNFGIDYNETTSRVGGAWLRHRAPKGNIAMRRRSAAGHR